MIGALGTAATLSFVLPDVAAFSIGLTPAHGAAMLSCALLLVALCVSRVER